MATEVAEKSILIATALERIRAIEGVEWADAFDIDAGGRFEVVGESKCEKQVRATANGIEVDFEAVDPSELF